jgi:hypothetical protein
MNRETTDSKESLEELIDLGYCDLGGEAGGA